MTRTSLVGVAAALVLAALVPTAPTARPTPPSTADAGAPTPRVALVAATTPTSAVLPGTRCPVFPASSYWHADVSRLPVSTHSRQWLAHMQAGTRRLHPDFGPAYGAQPVPYGIPVTVVNRAARVPVRFAYADESNRTRYPLSRRTKIEGGWTADGDRHAIVVDAATCTLFETWDTRLIAGGWTAGSGAVWSLRSNALRPRGWTSADAAGLAILPGLLRYDEIQRGRVDHAIRFTTNRTDNAFVWPARHAAGSVRSTAYPPMGARFRLKKSFSTRGFSTSARVVIAAMKRYGLVLADNGSPWYFQGTSDPRWGSALVTALGRIPASAFEAVDTAPLRIATNSGMARRR